MSDKLKKIIVKIVEKKKGVKLVEIVKYLEGKSEAIEGLGEVNFGTVKSAVTSLFSEGRIDIIEYKLPGEGEKFRIFALPKATVVTYTETDQAADAPQFIQPPPVIETQVILPADLFTGYVIIGDNASEFAEQADVAQATYMDMAAKNESPRLFGAVPIKLQVTALLETVHAIPVIDVVTETTTTVQHPVLVSEGIVGNTGTPGMLGQEVVNGDMQSTSV